VVRRKSESSRNLRSNPVNHFTDFLVQEVKNSNHIAPVAPIRTGWVTLTMPNMNCHAELPAFIEVHIQSRGIANERKDLCAIFDFPVTDNCRDIGIHGNARLIYEANLPSTDRAINKLEQAVLVTVTEFAQDSQERREVFVRSIVRLQRLDECLNRSAYCPKSSHSDCLGETGITGGNGESEFAFIAGKVRRRFMRGDCIDKMVEGGTQIVDTVSRYERPSQNRRRFINLENQAVTGAIRTELIHETIRVSVHPGAEFILDGLGVFLGPS
jgi:hypothetical protein